MTENTESARTPPTDGAPSLCFSFRARLAFCLALVVLIYSNTLYSPLIFDDIPHIVDNPAIRLKQIDAAGLWRAAFKSPHPNRPVANISFALNYRLHGLRVPGYHLVNIFVHLATGVFFYWLCVQTLVRSGSKGKAPSRDNDGEIRMTALAAATLWMVHPLQTQSVTYIVQRMNSLAAMFYLLTFLFYLRGRVVPGRWKKGLFFSASVISGMLAVGSKEIAVTLPIFLFLYEWFFFQDLDRRWLRRQWPWAAALFTAGALACWIYLGKDPLGRILADYDHRNFTLAERLMTEPRVIFLYLSLLAFPYPGRLNLDHHVAVSRSLVAPPTTLPALVLLIVLFAGAITLARRHRLLSFAVLWYLGNLVIESSILGLELAFEHRNYLPSMFLFLALVQGGARILPDRRVRAALMGTAVLVLGIWTFQRNAVWRSDLTLWQDCAAKSSEKARPLNNLAKALIDAGRPGEAESYCRKALALAPGYADARNNLGLALAGQGRLDDALDQLSRILPWQRPFYATAKMNMGLILMERGDFAAAVTHLEAALSSAPKDPRLLYSLGNALYATGRIDEAIGRFRSALQYAAYNAQIHNNLGIALMAAEEPKAAADQFKLALSIEPENADYKRNLAIARSREPTVAPPPGTLEKAQDKIGD